MTGEAEQFGGRHIIGPDTGVLNGVLPTLEHGAIVVDFEENPQVYEMVYRSVANRLLHDRRQPPGSLDFARIVNQVVKTLLPFEDRLTDTLLRAEAEKRGLESIGPEDEIELSRFIGGGSCHHQTLLGASILSLLQERQGIEGTVSVRMEPPETDPATRQHTWTRYTNGRRIVVDSAVHRMSVFTIEGLETPIESKRRFYLTEEELQELVDKRDLTDVDIRRLQRVDLRGPAVLR